VIDLRLGDCLATLRAMPDASVHSIVTDPPYGLGKEPDAREVLTAWLDGSEFKPGGSGFMGKAWDAFVPSPLVWAECLRVLKPGGHLLAFAGSRTYDWIVMGVRLAGFEVRDQLIWMYGSGFPKSMNVSKAIDRAAGALGVEAGAFTVAGHIPNARTTAPSHGYIPPAPATDDARTWEGYGTALKPAHEPIVMARKPLSGTVAHNVMEHGTGALNVDACRVGTVDDLNGGAYAKDGTQRHDGAESWGYLNGDAGLYQKPSGRWPANILHDGSPEVLAVFPETTSGKMHPTHTNAPRSVFGQNAAGGYVTSAPIGDTGSAARFFYSAKASRAERELGLADFAPVGDGERRNNHPCVKPVSVMRWLVRLVTPPGGTILDPYTGSGTTGVAAALEDGGFDFIGCELSREYVEIARARIAHAREFPAMWEPDYQAPDEVPEEQGSLF